MQWVSSFGRHPSTRRAWWALLFIALLGGGCAASGVARVDVGELRGPGEGTTAPTTGAEAASLERFLIIEIGGQRVGGIATTLRAGGAGSEGAIYSDTRVRLTLERRNGDQVDRFLTETVTETVYGPEGALRSERTLEREGAVETLTEIRVEGGMLHMRYRGPDREESHTHERPADHRSSRAVFLDLLARIEAGETPPVAVTYQRFDSRDNRFEAQTLTLASVVEDLRLPDGTRVRGYRVEEVDADGDQTSSLVDGHYLPVEIELFGGTLRAHATPYDPLVEDHFGTITSEIPVHGSVPRWWELAEVELEVRVADDDPSRPPLFVDGHYHAVQPIEGGYVLTLAHTRAPETLAPLPLPIAPPAELARYLEPTRQSQSDHPAIVAAARELVQASRNAEDDAKLPGGEAMGAAVAITEFVFTRLAKRSGARGSATATEVLEARAGDCTEHATLVVALMRAAGIPARQVSGIVYLTDEQGRGAAGYHAWAEIWLGRWIGVDAVFGETGTSARYLMMGIDEPGEPNHGAIGRTLGRIELHLRGYTRFGGAPQRLP